MPDARFRKDVQHDDLGGVERTVPALQTEVRRLRAELLRVQDTLQDAMDSGSWRTLLAAARRAWEVAEKALRPRPRH